MSNRITDARKLAGLSQRELAARMNLKPSTVSGYESGTYDPKSDGLIKIATICGVTVDYLLGLTDDPHERFIVTVTKTDPQIDELLSLANQLNAQGKERLCRYAEDLTGNPIYQKKKSPAPEESSTRDIGIAARGGDIAPQSHPTNRAALEEAEKKSKTTEHL